MKKMKTQSSAIGAATGAAFGYVGSNYAAGSMGNYTGHAVIGCASSMAQGGNCEQGAAAALVGKWVTNNTSGSGWNDFTSGVAAVVSGGVGSMITGGSFENGAKTAAYGYLFNQLLSNAEAEAKANARNKSVMQGRGCMAEAANTCAGITASSETSNASAPNSSNGVLRALLPASTAPLVSDHIGGSVDAQIEYSLTVNSVRTAVGDYSTSLPLNGGAGGSMGNFISNTLVDNIRLRMWEFAK
jgi:hypothetical protein